MNTNLKVTDHSERELANADFSARFSGDLTWRTPLLKWIAVMVVGVIVCTDLLVNMAHANNATTRPADARAKKITAPAALAEPMTTFVDGPTGFVFVYTGEGWKFVRAGHWPAIDSDVTHAPQGTPPLPVSGDSKRSPKKAAFFFSMLGNMP